MYKRGLILEPYIAKQSHIPALDLAKLHCPYLGYEVSSQWLRALNGIDRKYILQLSVIH